MRNQDRRRRIPSALWQPVTLTVVAALSLSACQSSIVSVSRGGQTGSGPAIPGLPNLPIVLPPAHQQPGKGLVISPTGEPFANAAVKVTGLVTGPTGTSGSMTTQSLQTDQPLGETTTDDQGQFVIPATGLGIDSLVLISVTKDGLTLNAVLPASSLDNVVVDLASTVAAVAAQAKLLEVWKSQSPTSEGKRRLAAIASDWSGIVKEVQRVLQGNYRDVRVGAAIGALQIQTTSQSLSALVQALFNHSDLDLVFGNFVSSANNVILVNIQDGGAALTPAVWALGTRIKVVPPTPGSNPTTGTGNAGGGGGSGGGGGGGGGGSGGGGGGGGGGGSGGGGSGGDGDGSGGDGSGGNGDGSGGDGDGSGGDGGGSGGDGSGGNGDGSGATVLVRGAVTVEDGDEAPMAVWTVTPGPPQTVQGKVNVLSGDPYPISGVWAPNASATVAIPASVYVTNGTPHDSPSGQWTEVP